MTPKEILLETLKRDGKPERLLCQYEAFVPIMNDPLQKFTRGNRKRGCTSYDKWGTEILFPEDAPGPMPHVTADNKVCPDITCWRDTVKVPDLVANCSEGWEEAIASAAAVDHDQYLTMGFMGTGIFEQCHYLMGFEDTLVNLLLEPDDMHDLVDAIAEYRFQYAKLLVDNLKPDVILSHDDWGSKTSLFMKPEVWRDYFKDHYKRIYGYMKDHGVIVMHHADSYCEPIVEDMVDIGIDIWQGVMNTNNIPELIKQYGGKITFMGGVDSATVDRPDWTREMVAEQVRKACENCGTKFYIPNTSQGGAMSTFPGVYEAVTEEIDKMSKELFK